MATWRNLELSELTRPTNCEALPRVVEADGPRSLADLRAFVTAERDRLRDEMLKRGGVLLRGFEVNEPAGFADIIGALGYRARGGEPVRHQPAKQGRRKRIHLDRHPRRLSHSRPQREQLPQRTTPHDFVLLPGRTPPLRRDAAVRLARGRHNPRPQYPGEARGKEGLLSAASSEAAPKLGAGDEPGLERGFRNPRPR